MPTIRREHALALIDIPPQPHGPAGITASRSTDAAQNGGLARFGNGRSTRAAIVVVEIVGNISPDWRIQDRSTEAGARLIERGGGVRPLQVKCSIDDMRVRTRDRAELVGCILA